MRPSLAVAAMMFVAASVGAQPRRLVTSGGTLLRQNGDTNWVERDTMVIRTVYRGDTIFKSMTLNGRPLGSQTLVAGRDSARFVEIRDSLGRSVPVGKLPAMSLQVARTDRRLFDSGVELQETRGRLDAYRMGSRPEPPLVSDTRRTYIASSTLTIVQYLDTVRFIRACPARRRIDTTTYVLYRADSLARVSEPRRMFGEAMALSVIGQMRMALTRQQLAARQVPLTPEVQRPWDPCAVK